jgi:hypothetical protein
LVRQIPATPHIVDYAVDLARATRPNEPESPDFVKNWLAWGAGPRAAQYLILGAKARALLKGRFAVQAADVRALAKPVLRHRIFTNFNADAEGIDADQVIERLLKSVKEPSYGEKSVAPTVVMMDRMPEEPLSPISPAASPASVTSPVNFAAQTTPAMPAASAAPAPASPQPDDVSAGGDQHNWPPGTRPGGR